MSAITYRTPSGYWGIDGVDLTTLPPRVYAALHKLCDIEHPVCPTVYERITCATKDELVLLILDNVDYGSPLWVPVCSNAVIDGLCRAHGDAPCSLACRWACLAHYMDEPGDLLEMLGGN